MTEQPRLVTDRDVTADNTFEWGCVFDESFGKRLLETRAALMECLENMLRDGTVAQINAWEDEARTLLTSLHEGAREPCETCGEPTARFVGMDTTPLCERHAQEAERNQDAAAAALDEIPASTEQEEG